MEGRVFCDIMVEMIEVEAWRHSPSKLAFGTTASVVGWGMPFPKGLTRNPEVL
jgi:hypothetical protein